MGIPVEDAGNGHSGRAPSADPIESEDRDGQNMPTELARLRADVIALLISQGAPDFRTRLLRELVRFAAGVPLWQVNLQLPSTDERLLRRIRRLQAQLTALLALPELDRKLQNRLADDLAEACERLYASSGQAEPIRQYDGGHDASFE